MIRVGYQDDIFFQIFGQKCMFQCLVKKCIITFTFTFNDKNTWFVCVFFHDSEIRILDILFDRIKI